MLFWSLIILPVLVLVASALWFRPAKGIGSPPDEPRPDSQLVRLLGLFEGELQETDRPAKVVGLSADGKALILSFDHQESVLSLPDLLRFAKVRGHQLHELVKELVEFLLENQSAVGDVPFDLAIPDLLPQIRTMDWIEDNSPVFGPARLLRSPLVDYLRTCYVLDEAETMVFLTEAHLASWGASLDAIHNLAMDNLRRKSATQEESAGTDAQALRVIEDGDGYSATRLLLHVYGDLAREDLVFGIPDRDKLYVGPRGEVDASWRECLHQDHSQGAHPLSPELYRIEGQTVLREEART